MASGSRTCCVRECKSNNKLSPKTISFHAFPKDDERALLWLTNCGREDLAGKVKNYKVCSLHFKKEMFAGPFQSNKLKKAAVPTAFPQNIVSRKDSEEPVTSIACSYKQSSVISEVISEQSTVDASVLQNIEPQLPDNEAEIKIEITEAAIPESYMCRVCLQNRCEFLNIFDNKEGILIPTMFLECGSVTVAEDDGLPPQICNDCFLKLSDAYALRQQIITADRHLHEILRKEEQITEVYIKVREDLIEEQQGTEVGEMKPIKTEADQHPKLNKVSKQKRLCCEVCNKTFKNRWYYNVHTMIHAGYRPFMCEVCGKGFSKLWLLNTHLKNHTGIKPYPCKVCGKKFRSPSFLRIHTRTHTGMRPYQCDICNKNYPHLASLKHHKRSHTGEKAFICEICGKTLAGLPSFNRHKFTHTDERAHSCPTCGKCFVDRADVNRHLRVHSGEKPFICEVCGKRFYNRSSLRAHKKIHEGMKPHLCKICGKCFRNASQIVKHMRVHSGERPYACPVCNKRFSYGLWKHMKVHKIK